MATLAAHTHTRIQQETRNWLSSACVRAADLPSVCVIICFKPRQAVWQAQVWGSLMNKGTVDTQQRRFQLSRTPNNTFPLTISGRATQVGIASLSGARVSEGEAKGANRRRTFTQILLLSLSLFADYC